MKAVILVGGEATRLLPLTSNLPKAMVPVLNTPFLEHVICFLSRQGISEIILTQRRNSPLIEDHFKGSSQFGINIISALEDTPLGTAGAVKNVAGHLNETFLVLNGDIYTDLDIKAMIDFHQKTRAKVTIALTPVDDPTSYGVVETNRQGRVVRFLEKPGRSQVTTNMINAGTYILEPEVLAHIPPDAKFSFERELFPFLLDHGEPVYAYPSAAYWIDIGSPEKYLQLHKDLLNGKVVVHRQNCSPTDEALVKQQSYIHPTVEISGPVMIGANCSIERRVKLIGPVVIGSGCRIQSEATIRESVVWRNVQIGPYVNVQGSILADNCCLNENSHVKNSILGDSVTVVSGSKLEPGSKMQSGTTVEPPTNER